MFELDIKERIDELIVALEESGEDYQIAVELAYQLKEEVEQLDDE